MSCGHAINDLFIYLIFIANSELIHLNEPDRTAILVQVNPHSSGLFQASRDNAMKDRQKYRAVMLGVGVGRVIADANILAGFNARDVCIDGNRPGYTGLLAGFRCSSQATSGHSRERGPTRSQSRSTSVTTKQTGTIHFDTCKQWNGAGLNAAIAHRVQAGDRTIQPALKGMMLYGGFHGPRHSTGIENA